VYIWRLEAHPATEETAKTAPNAPNRRGRSSSLVTRAIIVRIEIKIPAAPTPATARPKMRNGILGATPQKRDPISNNVITIKLRKIE